MRLPAALWLSSAQDAIALHHEKKPCQEGVGRWNLKRPGWRVLSTIDNDYAILLTRRPQKNYIN